MDQQILTGLAYGGANINSYDAYYATIAPGSILDQCEIDNKLLGVGGVVRCGNGSRVTAIARGQLSDRQGAYPSIRITPATGFEQVQQVHDSVELQLWRRDEQPVPSKRAHANSTAFVSSTDIPTTALGLANGYRAIRMATPGRTKLYLWFTVPAIGPRSGVGAQMDFILRTRRYGVGDRANGVAASFHSNTEYTKVTIAPTASTFSANDSSTFPYEFDLQGAEEIEVLIGNNQNNNDGWWVSVEARD